MKTKRDGLWLCRDVNNPGPFKPCCRLYRGRKPKLKREIFRSSNTSVRIGMFDHHEVESLFGVKLKPGQCREVSIAFTLKPPAKKRSRK